MQLTVIPWAVDRPWFFREVCLPISVIRWRDFPIWCSLSSLRLNYQLWLLNGKQNRSLMQSQLKLRRVHIAGKSSVWKLFLKDIWNWILLYPKTTLAICSSLYIHTNKVGVWDRRHKVLRGSLRRNDIVRHVISMQRKQRASSSYRYTPYMGVDLTSVQPYTPLHTSTKNQRKNVEERWCPEVQLSYGFHHGVVFPIHGFSCVRNYSPQFCKSSTSFVRKKQRWVGRGQEVRLYFTEATPYYIPWKKKPITSFKFRQCMV